MAGDDVRHRLPMGDLAVTDLDGFQIERAEHQFHLPPDERWINLKGVAVQRYYSGLGDGAVLRPQESLGEILGGGHPRSAAQVGPAVLPAVHRGLAGLGVGAAMVFGFNPASQQPVEFEQPGPVIHIVGG